MTEASKRKRRKLIQVLGLYAASAWAGIEFLLLVIDRTGLPPVWEGSVIALFLAGFPVAAWLTWVFADPETRPAPSSFRGLAHLAGSAALLVAVTAIVAVSVEDLMSGAKTASIAVLPCDDRGLAGQAHRANEIPEDVRSRLSQIPALRVTAWQSSKYVASMGMGVDETRETLGTGWVVQCAMRLEGDRLALEASLLKGSTDGESVWSRSFDFRVEDTMDVVERLTAEVVKRLGIQTEASRLQRILARPTFSAEAYDHYMRARQLWLTRTAENVAASVDLFFAALEIDPDFAHAWAGLGDAAWILKYHASESIIEEVRDRNPEFEIDPQAYALRAIELNDAVAEAWSVRWRSQVERGHWHAPEDARERARRWHEKVLMLDPNYALEYMWWVEDMDPPARATEDKIGLLRRGLVLDPASLLIREVLITYLRPREGSLPEILDIARTMLSLDPEFHRLPGLLASIEVERGNHDRSVAWRKRMEELDPENSWNLPYLAGALHRTALYDLAREYALRAREAKPMIIWNSYLYALIVEENVPELENEIYRWWEIFDAADKRKDLIPFNHVRFAVLAGAGDPAGYELGWKLFQEGGGLPGLRSACEAFAGEQGGPYCIASRLAHVIGTARQLGKETVGEELLQAAVDELRRAEESAGGGDRLAWTQARIAALSGHEDEALAVIGQQRDEGWLYPFNLEREAAFLSLHGNPKFQEMLDEMWATVGSQRDRVEQALESGNWDSLQQMTFEEGG